jgi:hypothetical protein
METGDVSTRPRRGSGCPERIGNPRKGFDVFVWEETQAERGPRLKLRGGTGGSRTRQQRGGSSTFQFSNEGQRRHACASVTLGRVALVPLGGAPRAARRCARLSHADQSRTTAQILLTRAASPQPRAPHVPIIGREGLRSQTCTPTRRQPGHASRVRVSAEGVCASRQRRQPRPGRASASYQVQP